MKYTVIAPITLGPGLVLGLSDAQAAARSGSLRALGKGKYEVKAAVQFKAGEVIHTDAELPKTLVEAVEMKKRAEPLSKDATPGATLGSESANGSPGE